MQNTIVLGVNSTSTGASTTVQPAAAITQRMGALGAKATTVTPTAVTAVSEKCKPRIFFSVNCFIKCHLIVV